MISDVVKSRMGMQELSERKREEGRKEDGITSRGADWTTIDTRATG